MNWTKCSKMKKMYNISFQVSSDASCQESVFNILCFMKACGRPLLSGIPAGVVLLPKQNACLYWDLDKARCLSVMLLHVNALLSPSSCRTSRVQGTKCPVWKCVSTWRSRVCSCRAGDTARRTRGPWRSKASEYQLTALLCWLDVFHCRWYRR